MLGEFHVFRVCFEGLRYALVSTGGNFGEKNFLVGWGVTGCYFLLTKVYTKKRLRWRFFTYIQI